MLEEKYPFLKQGHSFDTFVVSNSNNIAYNAAVAVAENPNGQLYNPLFLYSGRDLEKTHLMHSIARYILENHPEYSVMYTTSENFMNNVVDAIRTNRKTQDTAATSNLRKNYRNVDVLSSMIFSSSLVKTVRRLSSLIPLKLCTSPESS